jgi:hypothetical protein
MKGQIFIVTSIMVLLALFILRASTRTADVSQSESFYQAFSNLKGELIRTVDLSLINQESVPTRLDDFILFSKEVYARKGYSESVNYTVSPGVTTTVLINVSLSSGNSYLTEDLIISRRVYS